MPEALEVLSMLDQLDTPVGTLPDLVDTFPANIPEDIPAQVAVGIPRKKYHLDWARIEMCQEFQTQFHNYSQSYPLSLRYHRTH